jgi:hypothetical protein
MLLIQLSLGTALVTLCVIFHVAGLVYLASMLRRFSSPEQVQLSNLRTIMLITAAVLGVIFLHTIEIWLWAFVYIQLGEFRELARALYFSAVTATTLGYGDITLSESWQLLTSFEAMAGLILFGASTAFLIGLMRSLFTEIESTTKLPSGRIFRRRPAD